MANRPYLRRGCSFSPLPSNGQPHQTATLMLRCSFACPLISCGYNCTASRRAHRTQLDDSSWRNLVEPECYRANHSCSILRGIYKAASGNPNLTAFGKTTTPNIKTCCTFILCVYSFSQHVLITRHQVTSVFSPLLSSQPNLPFPSHPFMCQSLSRASSLFVPLTNHNQGFSLTLTYFPIVFSPLAPSSQLYAWPRTRTTWHVMDLLHSTGSSIGISSINIC